MFQNVVVSFNWNDKQLCFWWIQTCVFRLSMTHVSITLYLTQWDDNNAALPFPACVRQLHSSGAVLTKSNYGGLYPAHIRTTSIQKAMLAVGSGVAALSNPYRHGKWHTFLECSGLRQIVLQIFRHQPETVGQKRFLMNILVTWWENTRGHLNLLGAVLIKLQENATICLLLLIARERT